MGVKIKGLGGVKPKKLYRVPLKAKVQVVRKWAKNLCKVFKKTIDNYTNKCYNKCRKRKGGTDNDRNHFNNAMSILWKGTFSYNN